MPFGTKNVSIMFQQVMGYTLNLYLKEFFFIYVDDGSIYGSKQNHVHYLTSIFIMFYQYVISLNVDKYIFVFFF